MSADEMNAMYKDDNVPAQFRIDKKIPIAIIFVIIFQTFGFIWSAAKITSHVEQNIDDINDVQTDILVLGKSLSQLQASLSARIQTKQSIDGSRREADKLYQQYHELDVRIRDIEKGR